MNTVPNIGEIGEFGRFARLAELWPADADDVVVGIGDDAAVVRTGAPNYTLLTTDTLVEGVHFRLGTLTPFDLGYKALAVNISDIAAMAGLPRFCVVSLAAPPETEVDFVEQIYRGLASAAALYDVSVVGGDTTAGDCLTITVTLTGEVEPAMLRRRSGAQPGDRILVTGDIGRSAAGLRLLLEPGLADEVRAADSFIERHLRPEPRVEAARLAAELGCTAIEDISDGLASEVTHICERSGTGALIDIERLPINLAVRAAETALGGSAEELALVSGEEYELVVIAPRTAAGGIAERISKELDLPVTDVGQILAPEKGISVSDLDGSIRPLASLGYEHFQ